MILARQILRLFDRRERWKLALLSRAGKIKGFTGIDAPYEPPEDPEIIVRTHEQTLAGDEVDRVE